MREEQLSRKQAEGTITTSERQELDILKKESQSRDEQLIKACQGGLTSACLREQKLAIEAQTSYRGYVEYQTYYDLLKQYPDEMDKFGQLINDYSRDMIGLVEKGYTPEQAKAKITTDANYAAKYQQAMDDMPTWARIALVVQDTVGMVYGAKSAGVGLNQLVKNTSISPSANVNSHWIVPNTVSNKFPSGWGKATANKKGVGFRWQDPNNKGNGVRIDQGNPNVSQPTQQVDHVIIRHNGQVIGKDGKPIKGSIADNAEKAHIPLSEYKKWKNWNSPD
ncbi:DUF6862 domain-containing protein [Xenorhabdus sp. KK7.4]|uniref:DUF6862 domain-containing protein n=1 Tax=Xenorhabdus sp. KK7.4 TaxID=1851572 RepID=UPI000C05E259|nr:hypothetical protein [Xenorhabdus sp. KK7.4]PHM51185.1 hypothetical protein Xekk_03902 [Xenorhabdus sp. KK7.4]